MGAGKTRIAVIGAGAAGMTAAGTAASCGADVTVFEKNRVPGKKLAITGKGRCNVINNCTVPEFLENVPRNPKFLYTAVSGFTPADIMDFFEGLGVRLKTERGRRVFPCSDRAGEIVDALYRYSESAGASFVFDKVRSIERTGEGFDIGLSDGGRERFDRVILATGGLSYPLTGSDGDGYAFAGRLGHGLIEPRGSLVPLEADRDICRPLMGLTLKNIVFSVADDKGREVYSEFGEMLFTHFGISGPVVLSASAHMDFSKGSGYTAKIDLKPALDIKTLDRRILSDFSKYANRDASNALDDLLPKKLILPMLSLCGIDPHKKVNLITKEERRRLLENLKCLSIRILGARPVREAVITSGGIPVKEIDPKTMQSRLVPGLYFAGEIIDCDGYTGGYNLGIAFSTARLAGKSAAGSSAAGKNSLSGTRQDKKGKRKTMKIAIDGPGGAGKSYLAKQIAKRLGIIYVDTGALYRTVGLAVKRAGIDPHDTEGVLSLLGTFSIEMEHNENGQSVLLNGEDVGGLIRTQEISMYASAVSAIPKVREYLFSAQREIAEKNSVVMDGRDIGTVILPDADVKIFLTASPETRARRRFLELKEKGSDVTYEQVLSEMTERDRNDSTRAVAPAVAAEDAVVLDNTDLDGEATADRAVEIIREKTEGKNF